MRFRLRIRTRKRACRRKRRPAGLATSGGTTTRAQRRTSRPAMSQSNADTRISTMFGSMRVTSGSSRESAAMTKFHMATPGGAAELSMTDKKIGRNTTTMKARTKPAAMARLGLLDGDGERQAEADHRGPMDQDGEHQQRGGEQSRDEAHLPDAFDLHLFGSGLFPGRDLGTRRKDRVFRDRFDRLVGQTEGDRENRRPDRQERAPGEMTPTTVPGQNGGRNRASASRARGRVLVNATRSSPRGSSRPGPGRMRSGSRRP